MMKWSDNDESEERDVTQVKQLNDECVYLCELIEATEEFVENLHELLGRALRRQLREAHNVCEQDTANDMNVIHECYVRQTVLWCKTES